MADRSRHGREAATGKARSPTLTAEFGGQSAVLTEFEFICCDGSPLSGVCGEWREGDKDVVFETIFTDTRGIGMQVMPGT